jgi:ATP/maltotriose-dependent transcriptional regulator MalT
LADLLFDSKGDQTTISSQLEQGLALCREVGDKDGIASYFYFSGKVAFSQGDVLTAYSHFKESLALYREMGDRQRIVQSLIGLAKVAASQGDLATARALYEESLVLARMGYKLNIASGLEGLAGVAAAQGEPVWAARLWGSAETLREVMGAPIPPVSRSAYEHALTAARAQLGEDAFMTAWSEGRSMTPEQVLAAWETTTTPQQAPTKRPLPIEAQPSPSFPAGLTARELEVLRLVARGLTNPQIAQKLILSPNTIHTHVRSILKKLGVSSRGDVIRLALEHRLE